MNTPDDFPDWTIIQFVESQVMLIKRDGHWRYLDDDSAPGPAQVEAWFDRHHWDVRASPQVDPPPRQEDPWAKEDEHEFRRFDSGADYRHTCRYCRYPRRHPIHGLEYGQDREPVRSPIHNEPPNAYSVKGCYESLIDTLDEYNEMVPEGDRVRIPFALQDVIAGYIEEQEAIASIWRQQQIDNTPGDETA